MSLKEADEGKLEKAQHRLLAANADIALTYLRHACDFEPGSMGWNSNMIEATKYTRMAIGIISSEAGDE